MMDQKEIAKEILDLIILDAKLKSISPQEYVLSSILQRIYLRGHDIQYFSCTHKKSNRRVLEISANGPITSFKTIWITSYDVQVKNAFIRAMVPNKRGSASIRG